MGIVILTAAQDIVAEALCKAVESVDTWLLQQGLRRVLLYYPGCKGKPYEFDGTFASAEEPHEAKKTTKSSSSTNSVAHMTSINLDETLFGADYIRVHEFLLEQRHNGNIVIITSNTTNICYHTNDLLLPERGILYGSAWVGYNYLHSWRDSMEQYNRLRSLLQRDKFVPHYEYELRRPDDALCSYGTNYYLCQNYLGDEVRIGVSRPQDWRIVAEPETRVSVSS